MGGDTGGWRGPTRLLGTEPEGPARISLEGRGWNRMYERVAISFEASKDFRGQINVYYVPQWPIYSDLKGTIPMPTISMS